MSSPIVDDLAARAARQRFASSNDTLVPLYRRYVELAALQQPVEERHAQLRTILVKRWGAPELPGEAARTKWVADPDYAEFHRIGEECEQLSAERCALSKAIIELPAQSVAGAIAKIKLALDVWPPSWTAGEDSDSDYHEDAAHAAMLDALRLLELADEPEKQP